jgi:hypothetical protein
MRASGTFEVALKPQPLFHGSEGHKLGRFSLDKTFVGDLAAMSQGEMLSAGSAGVGSGAYVAMERIEGTLHGCKGSFVMQHCGTKTSTSMELRCTVVADSGTGELVGLSGALAIRIEGGKHY